MMNLAPSRFPPSSSLHYHITCRFGMVEQRSIDKTTRREAAMARGIPVDLGTQKFDNKGQATAYFKKMLNRYRVGDRVNEADSADLAQLLRFHDEYAEKVGVGIDHFEVMMPAGYTTQCFKIVRKDGSEIDFSYPHCIRCAS